MGQGRRAAGAAGRGRLGTLEAMQPRHPMLSHQSKFWARCAEESFGAFDTVHPAASDSDSAAQGERPPWVGRSGRQELGSTAHLCMGACAEQGIREAIATLQERHSGG